MKDDFLAERGIFYRTNAFVPGRQTLVFIHGISGSLSALRLYEEHFKNRYNIVTYDGCGHGKSAKPRSYARYALPELARDLEALLDHLHVERCVIVAHSYATMVALEFVHAHPERVSRVVLLAPNIGNHANTLTRLAYPLILLATWLARLLPGFGRPGGHIDYTRFPNSGDWNIPRMWADVHNTTLRVYLYWSLQAYAFDARPYLGAIRVPVLFMHGMRDTLYPVEHSLMMHERIGGSQLITLPDMDHILVLNRFPEVSAAIEDFLEKQK